MPLYFLPNFILQKMILNLTVNIDAPTDNTVMIKTVSDHMLNKYEPMIRKEIKQIRESLGSRNRNKSS